MSLPSIPQIAREMGFVPTEASDEQREALLVEAMRRDMPDAVALLEQTANKARHNGGHAEWIQDPNSKIGKELIRIHAGDPLRILASKHFCHGMELTFFNCCKGNIDDKGGRKRTIGQLMKEQIALQDGTVARADC